MLTTEVFGRIRINVPLETDSAEVIKPDGGIQTALPFDSYDAVFSYDRHGYETVTLQGGKLRQIAFTACAPGIYTLRTYAGGVLLNMTEISAVFSGNHGFVEVSKRDPRYFAFSDGASYVPVGLNLVGCGYDPLPAGMEHFKASRQMATTGML